MLRRKHRDASAAMQASLAAPAEPPRF